MAGRGEVAQARRRLPRRRSATSYASNAVVVLLAGAVVVTSVSLGSLAGPDGAGATTSGSIGLINDVSTACPNQNAEVEQALGPPRSGYVYEAWLGCGGIGFATSANSGESFSSAGSLPGSAGALGDPDVAVAANGRVYVSFMMAENGQSFPVVEASDDHGTTFPQVTSLTPPDPNNWGDSPNIGVGPGGTVYVTWDYGPSASIVVRRCSPVGSCSYAGGDLNVVLQKSTDEGKTFGPMVPISPGYPWSGADNAPFLVDPAGDIDVIYQDYPTNPKTHSFSPAMNYFTSSHVGGVTWSTPVVVGSAAGKMSIPEWWNQPSVGIDAGGNLYATWDTQGKSSRGSHIDTGWLSYSQDDGAKWSKPVQAPTDDRNVPHIMEVTGGVSGTACVGWLSDSNPAGYAEYLRPFSIANGWLTSPLQVSTQFGNKTIWPGDTFGLSTVDSSHVVVSWGSAVPRTSTISAILATEVTIPS